MASTVPAAAPPLRRKRGKSQFRELLETVVLVAVIFLGARAAVQPFEVQGHSMDPTLHNAEYILVDKLSYRVGSPQRGDIIVFKPPFATSDDYVKRVIGLPGDVVSVHAGQIRVDGHVLPEPYLPPANRPAYEMAAYRVPPHDLFVLGDNRNDSYDSHLWGQATPLPEKLVVGKARLAYWPLRDLAYFGKPAYPVP